MGMMQQMFASFQTTAGAPTVTTDSLFAYVSMLLNGDVSPTFIADASTNNSLITPAGNARNDVLSPFNGGNYSVLFNGTTTYMTVPASASWLWTGDYTLEAWVYPTAGSNTVDQNIFATGGAGSSDQFGYSVGVGNAHVLWNYASIGNYLSTTATIPLNTWTHIAVARSSSVLKAFVNGVQVYSATYVPTTGTSGSVAYIGKRSDSTNFVTGYISNLRLINGSAAYTGAFTPPTAPLTAITNTVLLTCQSSRFVDNSSNNFTISAVNTPAIAPNAPFSYAPTSASAYLVGPSDYITGANTAFGSGNFTVEAWYYPTSFTAESALYDTLPISGTGTRTNAFVLVSNVTTGFLRIFTNNAYSSASTVGPTLNSWNHIAVSGNSSSMRIYLNGVLVNTVTTANTQTSASFLVGRLGDTAGDGYVGYVSNLRTLVGTALYTSAFTPPTAPLTAITNTSLLTLQNNGPVNNSGIIDSSINDFVLTKTGGSPLQGQISPFSQTGWSVNFPVGGYITQAAVALGSGSFTVEGWWYIPAYTLGTLFSQGTTDVATSFSCVLLAAGNIRFYASSAIMFDTAAAIVPLSAWVHIAAVRNGTSFNVYVNGTSVGSGTSSATYSAATFQINRGYTATNGALSGVACSVSNFRVNQSVVYSSTFTPPIVPLTKITNTVLLTLQNNNFTDNSNNAYALVLTGSPAIQIASPFEPSASWSASTVGGSIFFNGSTDYLTSPATAQMVFGSNNFTVETWINTTSVTQYATIMTRTLNSGTWEWTFLINWASASAGDVAVYVGAVSTGVVYMNTSGAKINDGGWHHIAWVRNGLNSYIYVDGVQRATRAETTAFNVLSTASATVIATDTSFAGRGLGAYLSNLRVVNGTAAYTSAFTPPTAPLTATTNTALLLSGTNNGVGDVTSKNSVIVTGTAAATTSIYKYGSGSLKFNGTTDYLRLQTGLQQLVVGSGDFTIEAWVYPTKQSGIQTIYGGQGDGASVAGSSFVCYISTTGGTSDLYIGATGYSATSPNPTANQWSHVAYVRYGTTWKTYLNGTLIGSTGCPAAAVNVGLTTYAPAIGAVNAAANLFQGYIDDFRFTRGIARYTAEFTPPNQAFATK